MSVPINDRLGCFPACKLSHPARYRTDEPDSPRDHNVGRSNAALKALATRWKKCERCEEEGKACLAQAASYDSAKKMLQRHNAPPSVVGVLSAADTETEDSKVPPLTVLIDRSWGCLAYLRPRRSLEHQLPEYLRHKAPVLGHLLGRRRSLGDLRAGRRTGIPINASCLHPFDIEVGHFFQIDQRITRPLVDTDKLIKF